MQAFINKHQLNQIIESISRDYQTFAYQENDGKATFGEIKNGNLPVPVKKTPIPFKKFLWPDGNKLESNRDKKVAFLGIPSCDVKALEIFLKEFSHTDLLPGRKNIFVISAQCHSDEFCFCTAFEDRKHGDFDLHLQEERGGFSVFSGSQKGETMLKANEIKVSQKRPQIKKIVLPNIETHKAKEIFPAVEDFALHQEFWQKISNNCFGCGSCSAVCPLCFCVKQEETTSGRCLKWDSCFAKSFSEIQNHQDMRPKRVNRLYNWYHHKFVRAFHHQKHFLCTGCGRCIKACPAHLNQYKILSSLVKQEEEISHG